MEKDQRKLTRKTTNMKIRIRNSMRLGEIQEMFHEAYPYLKMEFCRRPHSPGEMVGKQHLYGSRTRVGDLNKLAEPTEIMMDPWRTTGQLEEQFQNQLGLCPQIWRLQGDHWYQTAGTDVLTLFEQNDIGRQYALKPVGESRTEMESLL